MKKSALWAALMALPLFACLFAAPAHAQATRTWVSGVGDDANPCSRTAPCKTFAGAISKTSAFGEINALDPGGFGAVTITKSITISAIGVEAGVLVSGTNGIVVAAGPNDTVVLEGLDIEGLGTGLNGVSVSSGLLVYVKKCKIHNFVQNGINMASSTSGGRVLVTDSFIFQNGTLNSSPLTGGININGNGVGNGGVVVNTIVDKNQNFAVQASGASNTIAVSRDELLGSPNGINLVNGGTSTCVGPSNHIGGASTCTTSQAFQ
jgi:hypothetical protein